MPTLDKVLELLKDGEWHPLREIVKEVGLSEDKVGEIVRFFAEYRFIQVDKERRRARLTPSVLEFLIKTRQKKEQG